MKTNYEIFRGKCKEACEHLQQFFPDLILVRGHFVTATGRREAHWWLKTPSGDIVDPTVLQFSENKGEYHELTEIRCSECGCVLIEEKSIVTGNGRYILCSQECYASLVGIRL